MRRMVPVIGATVLFTGLLAFVLWGPQAKPAAPAKQDDKVLDLSRDQIKQVEVIGERYSMSLAKESRKDGEKTVEEWLLHRVEKAPLKLDEVQVDQGKVSSFLLSCCPLTAQKKVAESATDLAQYGLDKPQWTLKFNGDDRVLEIGARNPAVYGYYARIKGAGTVYLIDGSLPNMLPQEPSEWTKPKEEKKAP